MSAVYFILLLGGLIFFHELGHFLLAKASGVRVLTFSIGFGPALLKKTWGDTEYKIAVVPLGGYVRMHGDEPGQEVPENERSVAFNYKPLWQRTLIVVAGPVFNLILPFFVFFFMFISHGDLFPATIGAVTPGGPAWNAGIRPGDEIVAIDGEEIEYWWQMQTVVADNPGNELTIQIRSGEETRSVKVVPEEAEEVLLPHMDVVNREGRIQVAQVYVEPILGIRPDGPAAQAGLQNWDRILRVDGATVQSFAEFTQALDGEGQVTLDILREEPRGAVGHGLFSFYGPPREIQLPRGDLETLGIWSAEMVVHDVAKGTAAANIGLRPGDRILTVDDKQYPLWMLLEGDLAASVSGEHSITWFDGRAERNATFSLAQETRKGEFNEERKVVVFGAFNHSSQNVPDPIPSNIRLTYALTETWHAARDAFRVTVASVAGLFIGRVPLDQMGGPILIYDMASKTEKHGWLFFFNLMAWLSISLGLINLFPIPILDGGHLFFFAIEAITRREVPMKIRQIAAYIGLALVLLLMVFVFYNDIARNWGNITTWFN